MTSDLEALQAIIAAVQEERERFRPLLEAARAVRAAGGDLKALDKAIDALAAAVAACTGEPAPEGARKGGRT